MGKTDEDSEDGLPEQSGAVEGHIFLEMNRALRESWVQDLAMSHDEIKQSQAKGKSNEDIIRQMLRKFLPPKYEIAEGFLYDCKGVQSKQTDVIIYDRFALFTLHKVLPVSPGHFQSRRSLSNCHCIASITESFIPSVFFVFYFLMTFLTSFRHRLIPTYNIGKITHKRLLAQYYIFMHCRTAKKDNCPWSRKLILKKRNND